MLSFLDLQTGDTFDVIGWTPQLQAKRKRITPWEAMAFEQAAHQAAPSPLNTKPEPTPAQAKADRYAKGHVEFQGLKIAIECPRGSYRRGVDPDGKAWECRMPHHYGYVERARPGADGEGMDVFIGQSLDSDLVVIVNQVDPRTREFDEHKVMLGFDSVEEAKDAYLQAYEPGWQGLGSLAECTIEDFKSWLEDGDLEEPARGVQKAGFAEAEGDGTRWITVHPHGNKDAPGHPVRIRPVAGKHGVYHVVGGADGKLNGLRLQGIKSPEHYRQESKARAKDRRKAEKDRLAGMTPQERQAHQEGQQDAKAKVKEAEKKLVETTLRAQGIDPAKADLQGTPSGLAAHKHHQKLVSHALKAAKEAEKRLLMDAEARVSAGLATVGGDSNLSAEDLLGKPATEHGPGYVRALKERAQEAGLTAQDLAEKVHDIKRSSAEIRVEEGKFSQRHEKLGKGDVVAGVMKAGELMGDSLREAHAKAKALQQVHGEAVKEALKEAVTQNDALAEIVKARAELRLARQAAKEGKPEVFQKGYQLNIEDLADDIIQGAEDSLRTERMMGLLDEVEKAHPHTEHVDPSAPAEDGTHTSRHSGAWDALQEIGLGVLGQGVLDRDTVEVLGPDGAAIVLARAIRTGYTPDHQKEIVQALQQIHQEEQDTELPQVLEAARQLREDAAKVGDTLCHDAHDLAAAAQMQRNKVDLLREACRIQGAALGRLEARAALLMALQEAPREVLTVPLGSISPANAAMTAAALGLKDGDYRLQADGGEVLLHLSQDAQDSLIQPVDQAAVAERDIAVAIKRGQLDEEGWLPQGFARRTPLVCDDPIEAPPALQRPMATLEHGADDGDIEQAMADYVGMRLAEGHRPADIMASMTALDFQESHFPGAAERADAILRSRIFPLGGEAKTFADIEPHLQKLTAGAMERAGISQEQTLHGQRLDLDHPDFAEALHQTLAVDPRLQAAFVPHANLSDDQRKMLRDYFRQEIAPRMQWGEQADSATDKKADTPTPQNGEKAPEKLVFGRDTVEDAPDADGYRRLAIPKDTGEAQKVIRAEAERMAGPEPKKEEEGMFGPETTPEWLSWNERAEGHTEELRKRARLKGSADEAAQAQALEQEVRENVANKGVTLDEEQEKQLQAGRHDARIDSVWAEYVDRMGGLVPATQALQDHMASRFADRFKGHYERRTGQPLRTAIVPVRNDREFMRATGTQDERDQDRSERARADIKLRKRDGGKLAGGSITDIREERHQQGQAAQASTSALLDTSEFVEQKGPAAPGHTQRWTLGTTAENQLRQAMPHAVKALQGQARGMKLGSVSLSGRYVPQQRAVKAGVHLKRFGLFFSAGAGKTSVMLGTHSELHHAGKVQKAIYAVPSAVQAQFGSEAAKFLDPKSGLYIHAKPGESFEDRMAAYQHPEVHGVVVTHQALRDDSMKVLGQHLGKSPEQTSAFVEGAKRQELAEALGAAWKAHGVKPGLLCVDEGHNALNRKGKEDSTLAKVMDALADNAEYYIPATADPIKNDCSESFDWLAKLDPKRYPAEGRDEFLRRYGKNTATSRRALKAELARYYFAERVDPAVTKADGTRTQLTHAVHQAETTPKQRQALDAIDTAMARIRSTKALAEAAPHARTLAPDAFKEGMSPEDEAKAVEKVQSALGTFRENAYNRVLNYDPEGGKVQATVNLAKASHEAGEPPIVFARNHAAVAAIEAQLRAAGLRPCTLTGKHSANEKAERIRQFQPADGSAPQADVLVMTDAGAVGINLQRGRHVIHHDVPYTHMIHSQRAARAWRLGQMQDVRHTTVAADHAFDHANLRRLKFKEELAGIFKSPDGYLDDTGTTERLRQIRERAANPETTAA